MEKGRLRNNEGKFRIDKKGNLEDNIKQLESELEVISKGAPKVYDRIEDLQKEAAEAKRSKAEAKTDESSAKTQEEEKKATETPYQPPVKKTYYSYHENKRHGGHVPIFKNSKLYIAILSVAAFGIILARAPIFRYVTPFRPDNDLTQVEVAFKYYNNILGKQTKQETLIKSGTETAFVPIPMQQWINLDIQKKILIVKEYLHKDLSEIKTP